MKLGSGFTNQAVAGASLSVAVQDVFDEVNAELTLSETGGSITSTAAEQNLFVINNPLGVIRPVVCKVDLDLMAAADTHVFRVYYRIVTGGAWEPTDFYTYTGVDGGLANGLKVVEFPLTPTRFGVSITIQRTAGADHVFAWEYLGES